MSGQSPFIRPIGDAAIGAIFHMMTESNLPLQIRQPWIKWGTDADGMDRGVE